MRYYLKTITAIVILWISYGSIAQEHLEHKQWDALVKQHVDAEGHVNYKGFIADSVKLNAYLTVLSANHPQESWKKEDQLAFWINAYNAFTVQLIIRNYPVKSIKELGGSIYKINTPWDIKFITIGEEVYDLNNIEHGIIRKQFTEPRIHFAVNCASVSCPRLRNEAFVGSKLDAQLDDQAKTFITDAAKNDINKNCIKISKIFKWFEGDFTESGGSVIDFINKYSMIEVKKRAKIYYMDYDWNLNE